MPTLLQINFSNFGSTGKIAEQIGKIAINQGWNSFFAYSRGKNESQSEIIRIGGKMNMYWHGFESRILDNQGLASRIATNNFIKQIVKISPDIIHLHNIHGYYLNYKILFEFLKKYNHPIVWTLHDCWPMTGHCCYFTMAECNKWKTQCSDCPLKKDYPKSFLFDRSKQNHLDKKKFFSGIKNLHIVSVSNWLNEIVNESFLGYANLYVIHNGVDTSCFKPTTQKKKDSFLILGVSNVWDQRKGLFDFYKLRDLLPEDYHIMLVGLTRKQIRLLPNGITGITRTANQKELADLYASANVLVNTTYADNFPTVNIEALACGTPVITYNTGGSPEAVDKTTGFVVPQGDVFELGKAIKKIRLNPFKIEDCRKRAELFYDKNIAFHKYIDLYKSLL